MVVSWWLVWVNGVGGVFQDHVTQVSNWVKMNRSCESEAKITRWQDWVTGSQWHCLRSEWERGAKEGRRWGSIGGKSSDHQTTFPNLWFISSIEKLFVKVHFLPKLRFCFQSFTLFSTNLLFELLVASLRLFVWHRFGCELGTGLCVMQLWGVSKLALINAHWLASRQFPLHLYVLAGANGNLDSRNRDRFQ